MLTVQYLQHNASGKEHKTGSRSVPLSMSHSAWLPLHRWQQHTKGQPGAVLMQAAALPNNPCCHQWFNHLASWTPSVGYVGHASVCVSDS